MFLNQQFMKFLGYKNVLFPQYTAFMYFLLLIRNFSFVFETSEYRLRVLVNLGSPSKAEFLKAVGGNINARVPLGQTGC